MGENLASCPNCGWSKTIQQPVPEPDFESQINQKSGISSGIITLMVFSIGFYIAGIVILFHYRGFALEIFHPVHPNKSDSKTGSTDASSVLKIRDELLSISSQIAGVNKGAPYNPQKIAKRFDEIKTELNSFRNDPLYFKVLTLEKSIELQFQLSENRIAYKQVPPLPYSPIALKPSEEYLNKDINNNDLLGGKIFQAGTSESISIRYGPALFSFKEKKKVYSKLFDLDAPGGYNYVEVQIGIEGNVELVEYSVRMLDSYRRAFPPFLSAEKESRKQVKPKNHFMWRDISKVEKGKSIFVHRIFLLPSNAIDKPILEIIRQGSSKTLWVRYP